MQQAGRSQVTRPSPGQSRLASSFGGTRNGMAIHWPQGITAKGQLRQQFHHVNIAPTILEVAGLPEPTTVNGTKQRPIEGVSLAYTFTDAKAKGRHQTRHWDEPSGI